MVKHIISIICLLVWLPVAARAAGTVNLPKTGQTGCWDATGAAIVCTNSGQDGDKQGGIDWAAPRFTDNTDGTVTDAVTGLMWTKNANIANDTMTWQAALDYVKNLNSQSYSGYSDWRLPNINELESLLSLQQADSSAWLNLQGFNYVQPSVYWSSTTYPVVPTVAWSVNMRYGNVDTNDKAAGKAYNYYVWPVRTATQSTVLATGGGTQLCANNSIRCYGPDYAVPPNCYDAAGAIILNGAGLPIACSHNSNNLCFDTAGNSIACAGTGQDRELLKGVSWPSPRFADNANGTVTDNLTGLIWLRNAACFGKQDWASSLSSIDSLATGVCNLTDGSVPGDWRLANRAELVSFINRSTVNNVNWLGDSTFGTYWNGGGFYNLPDLWLKPVSADYWTSSTEADLTSFAWIVHLESGHVDYSDKKTGSHFSWPVRSGQWGHPVVSVAPATNDFGSMGINASSVTQVLTITNAGKGTPLNAGLSVSSFAITGGDSSMFSLNVGDGLVGTCGATPFLPAGSSCTIIVGFSPTSVGSKSTTLRIITNDKTTPTKDITLSGTGADSGTGGKPVYTVTTDVPGGNGSISCITTAAPITANYINLQSDSGDYIGQGKNYNYTPNNALMTVTATGGHLAIGVTGDQSWTGDFQVPISLNQLTVGTYSDLMRYPFHNPVKGGLDWSGEGRGCNTLTGSFTISSVTYVNSVLTAIDLQFEQHCEGAAPALHGQTHWTSTNAPSPAGPDIVVCTITPAAGYHLATLLDNSVDKLSSVASNTYTISALSANHTIVASFLADKMAKLPKTGQTGCWSSTGASMTCDTTGQDGDKQGGLAWPAQRFSDNANNTISDTLTGLMWTKNANVPAATKTWQEALDYISSLNTQSYLGYSDWRLPNINELESLVNGQQANNATWLNSQGFTNTQADKYWSSTTFNGDFSVAWYVNMLSGYVGTSDKGKGKSYNYYLWPVRTSSQDGTVSLPATGQSGCWDETGVSVACAGTGQDGALIKGVSWPSHRFSDNADGTITDNLTGLIWLKNANCKAVQVLTDALTMSNTLATGACGLTDGSLAGDWRVPNRKEMMSLINRGTSDSAAWLITQGFTGVAGTYWTSTTNASGTGMEWIEYMSSGYLDYGLKTGTFSVLPVRSGQWGHPVESVSPTSASFGSLLVNTPSTAQTITIKNNGAGTSPNSDLIVSSIALIGTDSAMFSVNTGDGSSGTCGPTPTIAVGASCKVSVTFTPTGGGAKSASLRISSNDSTAPNKDIALGGTGTLPTFTVTASVLGGNGTISCASPVTQGNSSLCTISPNTGYKLSAFTDNSIDKLSIVASNIYTIANVQENHVISGAFVAPPVNGVCGSSNGGTFQVIPTTNLCTTGTPSVVSGPLVLTWTCTGSFGGTSATCTATKVTPVALNSGALFTRNSTVSVALTAPNGENMVRLGNGQGSMGNWMTLSSPMNWKLSSGDGLKTVYAQFKFANAPDSGNYTTYSATITLDTVAPTGSLAINNLAQYSNNPTVQLAIMASESVTSMCIKESATACTESEFEPFASSKSYTIANTINGKKTIYLTLRDAAGNTSKRAKASILLDTIAPTGSILINGGSVTTTTPVVTLKLTAVKASQMKFSVDGTTWSEWEKFATSRKITVPLGAGAKIVKVKFRDLAGNESVEYSASIELQ